MNDKLKQYLDHKEKLQKELSEKEKSDLLIREGLYEKEYSDTYSDEYSWYDNLEGKYYRKAPIDITDEEYEIVKESCKSDSNKPINKDIENGIATALTVIAWIIYIGGFIAGIAFGNVEVVRGTYYTYTDTEFSFAIAFVYWAACIIAGTMFLGFAEIIKLLEAIKRK